MRKLDVERLASLKNEEEKKIQTQDEKLASLHNKKLHYSESISALRAELEQNQSSLDSLRDCLEAKVGPNDWVIETFFKEHDFTAEFKDVSYADKHAILIAKEIFSRLERNEDICKDMADLLSRSRSVLSGMNRLSDSLEEKFDAIQRRFEGKKQLSWRDNQSSDDAIKSLSKQELENVFTLNTFCSSQRTPRKKKSDTLITLCEGKTPYAPREQWD